MEGQLFHTHTHRLISYVRRHEQVWDLREGQLFYTLHGHEGATLAAAFSPAGDYFASAGADEQVGADACVCMFGCGRAGLCAFV